MKQKVVQYLYNVHYYSAQSPWEIPEDFSEYDVSKDRVIELFKFFNVVVDLVEYSKTKDVTNEYSETN